MNDTARSTHHGTRRREWLYWPSRAEYVVPWTLGPALFMVLGALGFSTAVTQHISRSASRPGTSALIFGIAALLNSVLLLTHVRAAYLSWRCALRPTIGTLALLTAVYITLTGGWLWLHGDVRPAVFSGLHVGLTLHVAATGAQILTAVLMISAFWKIDEPRVADRLRAREVAIPVLKGKEAVSDLQYTDLLKALDDLRSDTLAGRVTARQREILAEWKSAAEALHDEVRERDAKDVRILLRAEKMREHIATLGRTC
jgi:hypothetical protein